MFEGASALCFGLDGALLAVCSILLGAGTNPSLRSFIEVRGWYAVLHMGIDVLRGCGNPAGTIGNVAHLAGFLGGFSYVLAVLPDIGGHAVPTVPCLRRGGNGRWEQTECLAFFSPQYSAPVSDVQLWAKAVLAVGAAAAVLNAFVCHRRAHASADGYSVLVKASAGDRDMEEALARSRRTFAEEQGRP
eukprot:TRINITY_DN43230_c0_g1_i1.p1 TRINITY_DN43230_c0_g1~~TRINITY_DN43230_c0_g1_i1.p1  ORF type:complete len:214 (+),score=34.87 TRINITY_DN43230_c0_g1_i1:76-642(+)